MTKIAFFDRDGTLNEEKSYLYKWEDFIWLPDAKNMLRQLKGLGYRIAVVTNQSGIARKYYSEKDVKNLHEEVNNDLFKSHKIKIDHFEICPHHPAITGECECRKPNTKMLDSIMSLYKDIDLKSSFIVGDKLIDLEAGKRVGIKSFLTPYGYGKKYKNDVVSNQIIHSYSKFVGQL